MRFVKWLCKLFAIQFEVEREKPILHNDIYRISIRIFFEECMIKKNLQSLIISGEPTEAELQTRWSELLEKYQEEAKEKTYTEIFDLIQEMGQMECRLNEVRMCVQLLYFQYNIKYVERLRLLGYKKYKLDPDSEDYTKDLQRILTASNVIEVSLNQLRKEHDEVLKDKGGKPMDLSVFYDILEQMSHFRKCEIDVDSTTVGMFLAIRRRMNDYKKSQLREKLMENA